MSRGEPTDEKLAQDYTSEFYPKRYSGTGFLFHAKQATDMLSGVRMSDRHSSKILDVGCGNGFLSQLYPNFDIVGIDISDGMLAHNPHKWVKAPAEAIPFPDNTFDFVVCRSLLHHLENPEQGLREMFRVLKPGGKWSCYDPNHNIVYEFIRHIFQHTDRFSHLHHSFNDRELFKMIEDSGLKITEKRYIGFFSYPLLGFPDIVKFPISIIFGRFLMWIDDLISKTPLKKFSWSLMVKAEKPKNPVFGGSRTGKSELNA